MSFRSRLLLGISLATLVGAPLSFDQPHFGKAAFADTTGSGESGESGEGGEAGELLAEDDAAYLAQLAFIEGHLTVGLALYQAGLQDMAATHMKHPESELYHDLEEALEARGQEGFEEDLEALAVSVESGQGSEAAAAAFSALQQELDRLRANLAAPAPIQMKAIVQVLRTASDEYALGVVNGKVVETHEYQDAYGFVEAAKRMLAAVDPAARSVHADAFAKMEAELANLAIAWPSLAGDQLVEESADLLYGTAARIELLSLQVK